MRNYAMLAEKMWPFELSTLHAAAKISLKCSYSFVLRLALALANKSAERTALFPKGERELLPC
jgi:hypothetical protein